MWMLAERVRGMEQRGGPPPRLPGCFAATPTALHWGPNVGTRGVAVQAIARTVGSPMYG